MANITDSIHPAGWAVLGAISVKIVDWLIARTNVEADRITATYDAVNDAQRQLVEGLLQQISHLREELNGLRTEHHSVNEDHRKALQQVDALRDEIARLKAHVSA